jgi:hypothetical protein
MKATALVVLWSFVFVTVSGPFAEGSIWEDRQKALNGGRKEETGKGSGMKLGLRMDFGVEKSGIEVPEELGTVVESWGGEESLGGKGEATVVEIEDAHGVYEAQKNAASILSLLGSQENALVGGGKKGLLVCVEGAVGRVNTEWAGVYPDEGVRKEAAESLLSEGEITGEEYLSLVQGPGKLEIWGVEEGEVYQANLKARRMLEKERAGLRMKVEELEGRLKKVSI